jgi:3-methyl-2-oxobutanoate hydroxymethyltransferase
MLTISIGSGQNADAQFLFAEDILGQSNIDFPRHAKMYRNIKKMEDGIQKERIGAFKEFAYEVKSQKFPKKIHSINISKVELEKFKDKLKNNK